MAKADYEGGQDPDYAETPVKNKGKSKGRKGNVPPKVYTVPDLINEGNYDNVKPGKRTHGGGKGNQYTKTKYKSGSPDGQNVKYQAPKNTGKAAINELPGQYTGVPKSGGK
jgi:hypothetical protein